MPTIEIPYTYEPDDEDEECVDVLVEVDYDVDLKYDDISVTGFHCDKCPEAAKAMEREYYAPGGKRRNFVNLLIWEYLM